MVCLCPTPILSCFESLGNSAGSVIGYSNVTDRGMASLGKLHQLEHLTICTDCAVSKRGLNELSGLTNLQTLSVRMDLDALPVIDEIKLNLSSLANLRGLDLGGFALDEGDLAGLSGLHHLERATLYNKPLPETALRNLKDLPALKHLEITQLQCTDGGGLASLAGLTGLRDLALAAGLRTAY